MTALAYGTTQDLARALMWIELSRDFRTPDRKPLERALKELLEPSQVDLVMQQVARFEPQAWRPGPKKPAAGNGPFDPGVDNVSNPRLRSETKIAPVYPEGARRDRLTGSVIVQAVITRQGDVSDLIVLRTNQAGIGFEEAAMQAVAQWKYEPALRNGEPVDVLFTVFVEFKLH